MDINVLEELIIQGDEIALKDLLLKKPDLLNTKTSHDVTPLMLACYFHKPNLVSLLVDFTGDLSLFEAAAIGKFDIAAHKIFKNPEDINNFSSDGFTSLGLACYFGNEEVARYLVLKGADVNLPSNNGYHVAPLHSAAAKDFTGIARMLIENGANVNAMQVSGVTALHSAAQNGNIELIISLLEMKADVNIRMEGGKLAADLAREKGFLELADILS